MDPLGRSARAKSHFQRNALFFVLGKVPLNSFSHSFIQQPIRAKGGHGHIPQGEDYKLGLIDKGFIKQQVRNYKKSSSADYMRQMPQTVFKRWT